MSTKKPSINDRALGAIQNPSEAPASIQPVKRIQTGPGLMSAHMAKESEALRENEALKSELKQWEESSPTKLIDSTLITRSKWANRHEQSFTDESFQQLKAEIESAGGNVQPIKVRPLVGQGGKFEIVFGHRRHQACLELGLPVLAMIQNLNEQELFTQMDQENRQRKDLRPYEQGMMYKRALGEGLFESNIKLAAAIGVDPTNLGRAIEITKLHPEVLEAFQSKLDIQFRWVQKLKKAYETSPDSVLATARLIKQESPRCDSKKVFERLLMSGGSTVLPPRQTKLNLSGKRGEEGLVEIDELKKTLFVNLRNIEPKLASELQKLIQNHIEK